MGLGVGRMEDGGWGWDGDGVKVWDKVTDRGRKPVLLLTGM